MFCRKCGRKIPDNSNFCDLCGTRVIRDVSGSSPSGASVPAAQTPVPPVPVAQAPVTPPRTPIAPNPVPPMAPPRNPAPAQPRPSAAAPSKPASSNTGKILIIVGVCIAAFILLITIIVAVVFIGAKIIGSSNDSQDGYTYDAGNNDAYSAYPTLDLFGNDYDTQDDYDSGSPETQRTLCVSCHGSGICPVCDGTGVYSNYGQSSECSACGGTGVCSICGGSGYN